MVDDYRHQGLRRQMVEYLKTKDISSEQVLRAMLRVPRHYFLDSSFLDYAYQDKAFPIGNNQTISSAYTVAFQSELLNSSPKEKILEIGTGSGYQTAVLCELGLQVYSVERQRDLYKKAKKTLNHMNYRPNLSYGDGYIGLVEEAPYDRILVTCGATELPPCLLKQLKIGGLMVIPLGFKEQIMTVFVKLKDEKVKKIEYNKFKFVPFLRDKV